MSFFEYIQLVVICSLLVFLFMILPIICGKQPPWYNKMDNPIKVYYQIRQDETKVVEHEGVREFKSREEYNKWYSSSMEHPFSHLHIVKTEPQN